MVDIASNIPVDPETRAILNLVQRFVQLPIGTQLPQPSQAPVALTIGETGQTGRSGFARPLGANIRLDLNRLRAELKKSSPLGKPRPTGFQIGKKYYRYRKVEAPGKLKASWSNPSSVQLSRSGKTILIRSNLPYARAVDKGRRAITFGPKNAKFLMFGVGGKGVFARQVTQKARRGQFYVKKAIANWRKQAPGRRAGLRVRWAPWRGIKATA